MDKILVKGTSIMTQTTQPCSWAALGEAEKEDNKTLLLNICGNLNELYDKLSRLSGILGKKIAEQNLYKN